MTGSLPIPSPATPAVRESRPETARVLLADLLCVRRPDSVVASAAALAAAFADAGKPLPA